MYGAAMPLPKSRKITGSAGFHPSTLKVLVRPAFLEPCSLMSIWAKSLENQTAEGIEPNRYAITRLRMMLKFFVLSEP